MALMVPIAKAERIDKRVCYSVANIYVAAMEAALISTIIIMVVKGCVETAQKEEKPSRKYNSIRNIQHDQTTEGGKNTMSTLVLKMSVIEYD